VNTYLAQNLLFQFHKRYLTDLDDYQILTTRS